MDLWRHWKRGQLGLFVRRPNRVCEHLVLMVDAEVRAKQAEDFERVRKGDG